MAQREELILDITAKLDQALKDVADLQAKVEALAEPTTVEVDANVEGADEVEQLATSTEDLDGTTAEVELEAEDDATDAVEDVADSVDDLDGTTAEVEIEADTGDAESNIDGLIGSLDELGLSASKLAGPAALGAIAGALGDAATKAYEFTGAVEELALFSGSAYEDASQLLAVLQDFTDIELGQLENTIGRVTDKFTEMPELAAQLGINLANAKGPLDVFVQTVDALNSGALSAAERIDVGMQIFGRGGLRAVNEIAASLEGPLADAIAKVEDARIIDEGDIARADEMEAAIGELNGAFANMAQTIGEQVVPQLTLMAEAGTPAVNALAVAVANQLGIFSKFIADTKFLIDQIRGAGDETAATLEEATANWDELFGIDRQQINDMEAAEASMTALADEANRWSITAKGMEAMPAQWDAMAQAAHRLAEGTQLSNEELIFAQELADTYRISVTQVLDMALQRWDDQAAKIRESNEAAMDLAEATASINDALAETPDAAGALADKFGEIDNVISGLEFDVNFQDQLDEALDGLEGFGPDLQTLADEWTDILSGKNIDIFGEVEDDPEFFAKLQPLIDLFQEGIVNEFEQGGKNAANTFAQSVAAQIAERTGLDIAEVYKIMGLGPDGSIDTIIQPAVDEAAAAKAAAILDALAGISGDPRIAQLQIALLTDNVPPEIAALAAQLLAYELGIGVKPVVDENTTQQEIDEAQAIIDGSEPLSAPVVPEVTGLPETQEELDTLIEERVAEIIADPETAEAADELLDFTAKKREALIRAVAQVAEASLMLGEGAQGVSRPRTSVITADAKTAAADRDLDTVADDRFAYIIATPYGVGNAELQLDNVAKDRYADIFVRVHGAGSANSAVNNAAEPNTARVGATATPTTATTSSGGGGGVAILAAPAPTLNANVTINAGVIGNRFEVQRAVSRALRQSQRLNGSRN